MGKENLKKGVPKVKSVQTTNFKWAYVDVLGIGGKRELVQIKSIFRLHQRLKRPFLPQHQDDFDKKEKYFLVTPHQCEDCRKRPIHPPQHRRVFIKFLGGEFVKFGLNF